MTMAGLINFLVDVNTSGISDSGVAGAMAKLGDMVQLILNIIYIVLGLFLIVKGALLGMQIVKAADEPQVRQEKIGSLKWLVIGVLIAYAVTFAADILTGYLAKNLKW